MGESITERVASQVTVLCEYQKSCVEAEWAYFMRKNNSDRLSLSGGPHGRIAKQQADGDCVAGRGWERDAAGVAVGDATGGSGFLAALRLNFLPRTRRAVARA